MIEHTVRSSPGRPRPFKPEPSAGSNPRQAAAEYQR
jgi:hypothetical protein